MNISILCIVVVATAIFTSCDPKRKVKAFALDFAERASKNQIDSLIGAYPGVVAADSLYLSYFAEEISVLEKEGSEGEYDVFLSPLVRLKVMRYEDGAMQVVESQGLFAYPVQEMNLAKSTGLWSSDINDAELARRMHDEDFYQFLVDRVNGKEKEVLELGAQAETSGENRYYVISNTSDSPVDSTDYMLKMWDEHFNYKTSGYTGGKSYYLVPGKRIGGGDTVRIAVKPEGGEVVYGLKIKISPEQYAWYHAKYDGSEFEEYSRTQKAEQEVTLNSATENPGE